MAKVGSSTARPKSSARQCSNASVVAVLAAPSGSGSAAPATSAPIHGARFAERFPGTARAGAQQQPWHRPLEPPRGSPGRAGGW
eukprot:10364247-Lingulodinium_polyedra.AAC.1